MPKHFLSVAAIFKNEGHILQEWIEHYLAEGVDHFYLIENNSTDNWEEVLRPYIEKGMVTLFVEKRDHFQEPAYNDYIFPIRDQTEWMIVCDLDEFVYGKNESIKEFIMSLPGCVNGVRLPWVIFGSSGHIKQPISVIDGFRKRKRYSENRENVAKNIARTGRVRRFGIHVHNIDGWVVVDGCGNPAKNESSGKLDEEYIRKARLLLNHYRVQSREWFDSKKVARGLAIDPVSAFRAEGYRVDDSYFLANDRNEVVDDNLAIKRGFAKSRLQESSEAAV